MMRPAEMVIKVAMPIVAKGTVPVRPRIPRTIVTIVAGLATPAVRTVIAADTPITVQQKVVPVKVPAHPNTPIKASPRANIPAAIPQTAGISIPAANEDLFSSVA